MNRASLTAIGIAAARAMERERPPAERIVDDPFARHFVGEGRYRILHFFDRLGWSERKGPGVMGYLVARERAIDEIVLRALGEGIDQLVILGAGFDARPYRFARRLKGVKVFEVDHPATQAVKRAKVDKFIDEVDVELTFVPVDFAAQVLDDALLRHGYDPAGKTLFVWQGVIMYLTPEAVDTTLRFIHDQSAPGSAVVLDYAARSAISGDGRNPEVRKTNQYGGISGERIRFGLDPAQASDWLAQRGFAGIEHVRSEELHARYFTGPNAGRPVTSGYGILFGRVP